MNQYVLCFVIFKMPQIKKYKYKFRSDILSAALWGKLKMFVKSIVQNDKY